MKLLLLLFAITAGDLSEEKIKISKSYKIDAPENFTVMVDNIFGDVTIEPSPDDQVYLELSIEIRGTETQIEKAKVELELGERITKDSILLYTKAPFIRRCNWKGFSGFNMNRGPAYSFKYQYKLKVPKNINIYAKTVDKGDVSVKDMIGIVKAGNVNGKVDIENARDVREASTVNGDVTISLLENPKESINFNTVNGDFNLELPKDFNAKIFFDSMNGNLYTAFDYKRLSPIIEKSEKNGQFKIGTKTGVEIGAGGQELSFSSINGNVYLNKTGGR